MFCYVFHLLFSFPFLWLGGQTKTAKDRQRQTDRQADRQRQTDIPIKGRPLTTTNAEAQTQTVNSMRFAIAP